MKCFDVDGRSVQIGIPVLDQPYPHVVLGEGGHKRATWVALGKRDAAALIQLRRVTCPMRDDREVAWQTELPADKASDRTCAKCGTIYGPWQYSKSMTDVVPGFHERRHPKVGEVDGPSVVMDASIMALKDKDHQPTGKYLIVAPRPDTGNRIIVLWRVCSGYRGSASISAEEGVAVIAKDSSWHSGRGNMGETAETLAVLKPGQELTAKISGRHVQNTRGRLRWDGKKIIVDFGGEELFAATSEEVEGEYV